MADIASLNIAIGLSLENFDKNVAKLESGIGELGNRLTSIGGGLTKSFTLPLVAAGAASLAAFGKIQSLQKGLVAVTGNSEEANKQFKQLQELAKLPGLGLPEVAKGAINLQTVGFTAEKAQKAIKSFGNAVATVGKGRESFEGAIYGLQQLANTEFPLGEDLNIIKDAIPQVTPLLKEAFGTARTEDLQKLGIKSQQVVDVIINGLSKLPPVTGGISNAFENATDSVTNAGSIIGDALNKAFDVEGKINSFSDSIVGLATSFADLSPAVQASILTLGGLAAATGPILFGIGKVVQIIPVLNAGLVAVRTNLLTTRAAALGVVGALAALAAYQAIDYFSTDTSAEAIKKNIAELQAEYVAAGDERKKILREEIGQLFELNAARVKNFQKGLDLARQLNSMLIDRRDKQGGQFTDAQQTEFSKNAATARKYTAELEKAKLALEVYKGVLKEIDKIGTPFEKEKEDIAGLGAEADKASSIIADINKALADAKKTSTVLGESFDLTGERVSILTSGIKKLIEAGLNPAGKVIQNFNQLLEGFQINDALDQQAKIKVIPEIQPINLSTPLEIQAALDFSEDALAFEVLADIEEKMKLIDDQARALEGTYGRIGLASQDINVDLEDFDDLYSLTDSFQNAALQAEELQRSIDGIKERSRELLNGINELVESGVDPQASAVQGLVLEYNSLQNSLRTATEEQRKFNEEQARVADINGIVNQAIESTIFNFAELAGQALVSGASFQDFGAVLLSGVGDLLVQLGQTAIQTGVGIEAIKKSFATLGGVGAIAAGAALVAFGTAIKGKVKSIPTGGGSGSTPTTRNSSSSSSQKSFYGNVENRQTVEIEGETVVKGDQLITTWRNAERKENRTTNRPR